MNIKVQSITRIYLCEFIRFGIILYTKKHIEIIHMNLTEFNQTCAMTHAADSVRTLPFIVGIYRAICSSTAFRL